MRGLVVEDDADARDMLRISLQVEGHDVTSTTNGEEAWGAFQNGNFSIVLSDWLMPDMDGLELCRRIRARNTHRYCYILLLTALHGKSNYLAAMSAGADDFMSKPYDLD